MAPKMIKDQKKVFFGIRAASRIIDLYWTLMKSEDPGPGVKLNQMDSDIATTR